MIDTSPALSVNCDLSPFEGSEWRVFRVGRDTKGQTRNSTGMPRQTHNLGLNARWRVWLGALQDSGPWNAINYLSRDKARIVARRPGTFSARIA